MLIYYLISRLTIFLFLRMQRYKQIFVEGEANYGRGRVWTQTTVRDSASRWKMRLAAVVSRMALVFLASATSNAKLINTKFVFKPYESINQIMGRKWSISFLVPVLHLFTSMKEIYFFIFIYLNFNFDR
jgi:hypothetical protein